MKKSGWSNKTKALRKVGKVMHEFKEGTLHSGKSDKVVKNPKQAIAIALSEAGLSKKETGGGVGENTLSDNQIKNYFPPQNWTPEGWSKELYSDGYRYFDEKGNPSNYDNILNIWHKNKGINIFKNGGGVGEGKELKVSFEKLQEFLKKKYDFYFHFKYPNSYDKRTMEVDWFGRDFAAPGLQELKNWFKNEGGNRPNRYDSYIEDNRFWYHLEYVEMKGNLRLTVGRLDNQPITFNKRTFSFLYADGGAIDINDFDMPVIRSQFEDEEYEYAKGGSIGDSGMITDKNSMFVGKMGTITGDLGDMYEVMVLNDGNKRTVLVKKNGISIVSDEYAKGGGTKKRSLMSMANLVDWKGEGIKKWYMRSYPTDELGEELNDDVTFRDLMDALNNKQDVYEIMGVADSVVRERLFEYLSLVYDVDYDVIYKKWLDSDDYAKGGGVGESNNNFKEIDGNKYFTYDFENKGNKWGVLISWGKYNHVNVTKKTNNPFGYGIGKEFNDIGEAVDNYKDVNIKSNILFAANMAKEYGYEPKYADGGAIDINDFDMPVIRSQFEEEEFEFGNGGAIYSRTMRTPDGTIVGKVQYNDFWKTYQVVIDGTVYEEFKTQEEAIQNLKNAGFDKMARGGEVENENREMVLNNNKQIAHHTKEMSAAVRNSKYVPAWVVAKVNRSATDLSDATHYMEGEGESYANGGETKTMFDSTKQKMQGKTQQERIDSLIEFVSQSKWSSKPITVNDNMVIVFSKMYDLEPIRVASIFNKYQKQSYATGGNTGGTSDSAEMNAPTLGGTMTSSMAKGGAVGPQIAEIKAKIEKAKKNTIMPANLKKQYIEKYQKQLAALEPKKEVAKKAAPKKAAAKKVVAKKVTKAVEPTSGRTERGLVQDKQRLAKKGGKRISESGGVYYENRENHSDKNRKTRLEDGGTIKGWKHRNK